MASVAVIGLVVGGSSAVLIALLIEPMQREFGWSSAVAASTASAFGLATLASAPLFGLLVDKLGARAVITFGVVLALFGFLLVSRSHSRSEMLVAFALIGLGYCASCYVACAVVITDWMEEKKNLGMGVIVGAISAGAALFSALLGWWIAAWGWRIAVGAITALTALTVPVAALGVKARTVDTGATRRSQSSAGRAMPPRDILFSRPFLLAVSCSCLFSVGMAGIYYHVVPILLAAGYSTHRASLIFGATWLLSALGSFALGSAGDRFGTRQALALALLACAVGTAFLRWAGSAQMGLPSIFIFTLLWGSTANCVGQFVPLILAEYFGAERLGGLVGLQAFASGVAGASAPVVTGLLFDNFKDYDIAILVSAAVTITAAILLNFMGPVRVHSGVGARCSHR